MNIEKALTRGGGENYKWYKNKNKLSVTEQLTFVYFEKQHRNHFKIHNTLPTNIHLY